ncbi:hypothetical protein [Rhizobium ruizarguesonis]|uniref:hypothetical protein n=1 Tax=Rhizobium ruizarguesonis TaxID=2081791 RepID=UPI0013DF5975|nr:hypothetical protein [Rhizobium ruizarguesonis]NEJ95263.1 hypothetical protein [Rhizobium ruizarguesonis]
MESQAAGIAKTADEINTTALLLGLTTSFLGGSQRFIKVAAQPQKQAALEALIYFVETLKYDPAQAGDQDDDE